MGWLSGLCRGLFIPVEFYTCILCFPSVIFLALCWKMPESPMWLMREGRETEARQTLQWLRGNDYNMEPEVKELEALLAEGKNNSEKSVRELVTDRAFIFPLFISCSCFLFQALCGCDTISYYTGYIFKDKEIRMEYAAIIFQMTITFGYLVS